jgi:hypothetical protein
MQFKRMFLFRFVVKFRLFIYFLSSCLYKLRVSTFPVFPDTAAGTNSATRTVMSTKRRGRDLNFETAINVMSRNKNTAYCCESSIRSPPGILSFSLSVLRYIVAGSVNRKQ